jgi:NADH dehydrogenase FAD-containing subunit
MFGFRLFFRAFVSPGVSLLLLILVQPVCAQQVSLAETQRRNWDLSVWAAGATGEENTDSFAERRP